MIADTQRSGDVNLSLTDEEKKIQLYAPSLTSYKRLPTKEVQIGDLYLGNHHPIRVQTMTTTDTMDTFGTVEQSIVVSKPEPNWFASRRRLKKKRKIFWP